MHRRGFFLFFLFSGFCGLLYEVVWTRLALAHFGVTTTIVSIVLSVFMLGLAIGAWLSGTGRLLRWLRTGQRYLRAYAIVEILIGTGAIAVPALFEICRHVLLGCGDTDSQRYHLVSGLLLGASLLPWATLLGATFALAMGALRVVDGEKSVEAERAFSYLYLANVLGAALGTVVTAVVLIELLGFTGTLLVAAAINVGIAGFAWVYAGRKVFDAEVPGPRPPPLVKGTLDDTGTLAILFLTGFVSMAMELIWTRLYSYYLGTFVYAFAGILTIYLLATFAGSHHYRRAVARADRSGHETVVVILGVLGILPLLTADPRLVPPMFADDDFIKAPWTVLAIVPFCFALGYLTPMLVDRYSHGSPGRAARAYSVNVLGCILGPLAAGYLLLPAIGERFSLIALVMFLLAVGAWSVVRVGAALMRPFLASVVVVGAISATMHTYAESFPEHAAVLRDTTATVVAYGSGLDKRLLVNGVGITSLTTVTKVMAHLPLAFRDRPARALVICFGMGTTMRSLASWGIDVTAVELVPSVPLTFDYFFPDAHEIRALDRVHIVIDDGRRFMDRTRTSYDVITLDPPPPVEAAGSSLLYSREFYQAVKARLADGGILQQWVWGEDPLLLASATKSIAAEFPYVRAFRSPMSRGTHYLASMTPIPALSAAEVIARLPAAARADLMEWLPGETPESLLGPAIANEKPLGAFTAGCPSAPELTDDRPTNEYFLLRALLGGC